MKTKKGFTLVELLVVIAVIALLMSILMPALRLAKKHAMRVYCANNVKQLTLSLLIYAGENNDFFTNHMGGGSGYWLWGLDWRAGKLLMKYGATKDTFYCPANLQQKRFRDTYWQEWWPDYEHIIGYFSLWDNPPNSDPDLFDPRGWQPRGSGNKFFPVKSTCERASEIQLLTDVTFSNEVDYGPPEFPKGNFVRNPGGMVSLGTYDSTNHVKNEREAEGSNEGFADGHVDWLNFNDLERRGLEGMRPTHWW